MAQDLVELDGVQQNIKVTLKIFTYLPVLLVTGVITGGVIGLLGGLVTERIVPVIQRMRR